jgi:hypothetical protein
LKRIVDRTELLAGAAVVVLGAALATNRLALRDLESAYESVRVEAVRNEVAGRLTGREIAAVEIRDAAGAAIPLGELARDRAVWVLSPGECVGCLDRVDDWNRSGRDGMPAGIVVLSGIPAEEVQEFASRARLRIPVFADPDQAVRRAMGLRLPSTYLFVDPSGTILLSDAHSERTSCNWSFVAQVAALRGSGDPRRLRG